VIISFYPRPLRHWEQGRIFVAEDYGTERVRSVYRDLRRQGLSRYDARFAITSMLGVGRHSRLIEVTK